MSAAVEPRARRLRQLAQFAAGDTWRALSDRRTSRPRRPREDAIEAALRWLCLSHDVTGRQGSSRGYSLVKGWAPAFPETTGYVIGTLLACAERHEDDSLVRRAEQMADWEIEVQCEDGGVMEGVLTKTPKRSTIFNTGMVMHGWIDLHEHSPHEGYLEAAVRGGEFLRRNQDDDGAWRGEAEYFRIPHTYCSRVSWALLRLAEASGEDSYRQVATRQLDWVVRMQTPSGWFRSCEFEPGKLPNSHGIAYTLRGLLESFALTGNEVYLEAVRRTADVIVGKLAAHPNLLPATFDASWRPRARYECLTGTAQLGGVLLRLHELTGEQPYLDAGLSAVERAASRQVQNPKWPDADGALPGSFPIYGRYAPLAFPNWAAKFLLDSLLLVERNTVARSDALSVG
jgi:DUF1680 family protein